MARRRIPKGGKNGSGAVIVLAVMLFFSCIGMANGGREAARSRPEPAAPAARAAERPTRTPDTREQASRVTSSPQPTIPATATPVLPPVGVADVVANLRSAPRIAEDTVIGKLCIGDTLDYISVQEVGSEVWYRVRVTATEGACSPVRAEAGRVGWVSSTVVSPPSYDVQAYAASVGEPLPTAIRATALPRPTARPQTLAPQPSSGGRIGAICRDGSRSFATGRGACSHHGGVAYWLYGP